MFNSNEFSQTEVTLLSVSRVWCDPQINSNQILKKSLQERFTIKKRGCHKLLNSAARTAGYVALHITSYLHEAVLVKPALPQLLKKFRFMEP